MAGGVDDNGVELNSIEIFNPTSNTFVLQSVTMSSTREGFGALLLKVR